MTSLATVSTRVGVFALACVPPSSVSLLSLAHRDALEPNNKRPSKYSHTSMETVCASSMFMQLGTRLNTLRTSAAMANCKLPICANMLLAVILLCKE